MAKEGFSSSRPCGSDWPPARQITLTFSEGTSKRRAPSMIYISFLAPDVARHVLDGRQALCLASDWYLRHELSPGWCEQRRFLTTLREHSLQSRSAKLPAADFCCSAGLHNVDLTSALRRVADLRLTFGSNCCLQALALVFTRRKTTLLGSGRVFFDRKHTLFLRRLPS